MSTVGERVAEPYDIIATSSSELDGVSVLRQGDSFALLDRQGDIHFGKGSVQGLYHGGTRFLSHWRLTLSGERPLLLSSQVKVDNVLFRADLTNPDMARGGEVVVPRGSLHLSRSVFLWDRSWYETVRMRNFGDEPVVYHLNIDFRADFADVFEVRGMHRAQRGSSLEPWHNDDSVVLSYRGLDGRLRRTRLVFQPRPRRLTPTHAHFAGELVRGDALQLLLVASCEVAPSPARTPPALQDAFDAACRDRQEMRTRDCEIYTGNEQFNEWVNRSFADLRLMLSEVPHGWYPYAGIPWYSTEFGRDGIITALQTLWFNPDIARGVLGFLSAAQADRQEPDRVAEPGKIVHEIRRGEMAELHEIPFGRYYGTVDATPLFVLLADAYYERTGDLEFIERIWPNIERALDWIDRYGDADHDGFVEYTPDPDGLTNQGWKDSSDSVFHADGTLAEGSIALCEVQAYTYAAKRGAADLARRLGFTPQAERLAREAAELQVRFEREFWSDELGMYVLALDGRKRPCRVRTSNAGQCLFTGIASESMARRIAARMLEPDFFSGWGIRTVAAGERRYNPMSYHNGSVWPHDTALIGLGLARYGFVTEAGRVLGALFDLSLFVPMARMPELVCGFDRRPDEGPTLYPAACSPQAWAAGAVFNALQATLGLRIDGRSREIIFTGSMVPQFLGQVRISNLRVGDALVDLVLIGHRGGASIQIERRTGDVRIVAIK